jgi:uncharacterized protein
MIARDAQVKLLEMAQKFWVVALLGPRQSGKTTLAQMTFPEYEYVSLENIATRGLAAADPLRFLDQFRSARGVIFDEIQQVPELLSYIQIQVDKEKKFGFFIITGSQNFLLNQAISQTLAGRIFIIKLLPLSPHELINAHLLPASAESLIFTGSYPSVFQYNIAPRDWYSAYMQTYVERDVRQLRNITDVSLFQQFIKLCAGRIGQLLNITSLANDCGISVHTAKGWISILEASFILFLVQPHFKNFSKRLIKAPKVYFYDTGLACYLLGIASDASLTSHYLRGGLFECLVINSLIKNYCNRGIVPPLYFWRDQSGHEVDCILEHGENLIPIEIKSGKTFSMDFFNGITYFNELAHQKGVPSFVVYAGDDYIPLTPGTLVGWKHIDKIPVM